LRECSRIVDELQEQRTAQRNRLEAHLRRYFPQFLEVTDDVAKDWSLELWTLVPTPRHAEKVSAKPIEALLSKHRIRRVTATEALKTLRKTALTVAPGTTEAATAHIELIVAQLALLNKQRKATLKRLDECIEAFAEETEPGQCDEQRDVKILSSLPGVGSIVLATLLSEASRLIANRDYHAMRIYAGLAPVTRRSGKTHQVLMRRACNPRLRQAVYHWARVASQCDPLSKARYASLRARGHSHGRALRSVGDRLLKVAIVMLTARTEFQKNHSECALAA
jgi:transposase